MVIFSASLALSTQLEGGRKSARVLGRGFASDEWQ
jgi:hypothetical protein